jgi:hypothetical protein
MISVDFRTLLFLFPPLFVVFSDVEYLHYSSHGVLASTVSNAFMNGFRSCLISDNHHNISCPNLHAPICPKLYILGMILLSCKPEAPVTFDRHQQVSGRTASIHF